MSLAWYEMTEEYVLPLHVSWRELADHWLTHDPMPERREDEPVRIKCPAVAVPDCVPVRSTAFSSSHTSLPDLRDHPLPDDLDSRRDCPEDRACPARVLT